MAKIIPADETDKASIPVVRDNTFTRASADRLISFNLGRDVELAYIQYGPAIKECIDRDHSEEFVMKNVMTEVCRIRMSFPSAFEAAMSFIKESLSDERVKADAVRQALAQWADEADADDVGANDVSR